MPQYTKQPVTITAEEYTEANRGMILAWVNAGDGSAKLAGDGQALIIETLEGPMRASLGDFIIQGVEGEFYPCKPDIFRKTYSEAGAERRAVVDVAKIRKAQHYLKRAPNLLRQMAPSIRLDGVGIHEASAELDDVLDELAKQSPQPQE